MLRGIYTSAMGLAIQDKKMDVISNNLANVNTNGYKRDTTVFETFDDVLTRRINDYFTPLNASGEIGDMQLSNDVGLVFTDYSQGQLIKTDNPTDLSITGSDKSFFVVEVPGESGTEERYTRDGAFTLDASGKLVTREGYEVKGTKGPIILTSDNFNINDKGEVIQDGNVVDNLMIKTFKDTANLRKMGDNLIKVEGETEEEDFKGKVVQGSLENSNINSIREMVDMITVVKAYEANQKVLRAQDETLGRAVNDIPSLRA